MDVGVNGSPLIHHHEWWQQGMPFHVYAQVTAFPTALLYTPRHVAAAMSLLLAWFLFWRARFRSPHLKLLTVGLLVVNAFYSSVFVMLGGVPFLLVEGRVLARRLLRSPVMPLLAAVWWVPLFLFVGKLPGQHFMVAESRLELVSSFWLDKFLSFPFWLILISVVELSAIPLWLVAVWGEMRARERQYFTAALLFYVSTYVVAFTGSNNYSMRGMLVPTMVMVLMVSRHLGPRLRRLGENRGRLAVAALLSLGTVVEFTGYARRSLLSMKLTWLLAKGEAAAAREFPVDYRTLARDRTTRFYRPRPWESPRRYFNAEKLVDVGLAAMERWERELLREPRRGLLY